MIFSPALVGKVLDGSKTVTRRRIIHRDGRPLRYQADGVYAVQPGRGKPHLGHIAVRSVSIEPLQAITEEEAVLEGFEPDWMSARAYFEQYWSRLHGGWSPQELIARIAFVLVPICEKCGVR